MNDQPLVVAVGTALYGSRWQSELARALEVSDRTVRRWAAGQEIPRPGVYRDLLHLVRERARALGPLEPLLEQAARAQTTAP
jgi:hypothetical protein